MTNRFFYFNGGFTIRRWYRQWYGGVADGAWSFLTNAHLDRLHDISCSVHHTVACTLLHHCSDISS